MTLVTRYLLIAVTRARANGLYVNSRHMRHGGGDGSIRTPVFHLPDLAVPAEPKPPICNSDDSPR
jgi:hypothetical protein